MTWIRRLLVCLLLTVLAGCSRSTPFCDYAAGLVKQSQLTGAASAYAEAQRRGEGSCGDDGLDQVVKQRGTGQKSYEKGMAAVRAGDVSAARALLQTALRTDQGDVDAAAQLQRLGQPAQVRAVPATVIVSRTVSGQPATGLAQSALAVALSVFVLLVAAWLRRRRSLATVTAGAKQELQGSISGLETKLLVAVRQAGAADDLRERLHEAKRQIDRLTQEHAEHVRLGVRTTSDLRTLQHDLERIRKGMESSGREFAHQLDTLRGSDEAVLRLVASLGEMARADERFIDEEYTLGQQEPDDD